MSLHQEQMTEDVIPSHKKLVDEYFVFFLPTLGAVYGERGAIFLQKVYLLCRQPYHYGVVLETTKHEGFTWVRIPDWLIYDQVEGMMPSVGSEAGSYNMRKALIDAGALKQTNKLNIERSDKTNWFRVAEDVVDGAIKEHLARLQPLKALRDAEKAALDRIQEGRKKKVDYKPGIIETVHDNLTEEEVATLEMLRSRVLDGSEPAKAGSDPVKTRVAIIEGEGPCKNMAQIPVKTRVRGPQNRGSRAANIKPSTLIQEIEKNSSTTSVAVDDEISLEINSPASDANAPTGNEQTPVNLVEQQLFEFAAARKVAITTDEAAALVATWPAAQLPDGKLFAALASDFESFGLDVAVDRNMAKRKLADVPAARLRWFMCVWPAFEESTDAYHERTNHRWTKTTCFLNKAGESQPAAAWLEKTLATMREANAKAENEAIDAECREYWNGLTKLQKAELEIEVKEEFDRRFTGQLFTKSHPDWPVMRLHLLRKPEVREMLADVQRIHDEGAPKRDLAAALATAPVESAETRWEPETVEVPIQARLELYIKPILEDLNAGVLELSEIDERRPALLDDAEWREITNAVIERRRAA